jgi:hypothetical protein
VAFEIGAAASLASIIVLEKTSKTLVWSLFILLTAMQMQGNMFYAYTHLENFQDWIDLFGLQEEELITQKRILSIVSGAILPVIALGFIKSLVDYIRPEKVKQELAEIPSIEKPIDIPSESQTVKEVQPEPQKVQPKVEEMQKSQREVQPEPQTVAFENSLPVLDGKTGNVVIEPKVSSPHKNYNPKP